MAIDFTAFNLVKGSLIRLLIDFKGKNWEILSAITLLSNILNRIKPYNIPSIKDQINRAPTAKAERFTNMPKNRPKEKKAMSLTKKAMRYSKSDRIMFKVLKSE